MWGKLIVFEGSEGSGKTTQLLRSRSWLIESGWAAQLPAAIMQSEQKVIVTREPGGTALGVKLRNLLLGTTTEELAMHERAELLLYAADRVQHVEGSLKPHLVQGAVVLCDRYTDSTVAYQGYGRGLSLELIDQVNAIATGGLTSDLTLWLDLDVEVGLTRIQKRNQVPNDSSDENVPEAGQGPVLDRIEQIDLGFHQRVRQGFSVLAQQHPERIVRIDASQSEAAVTQQIQTILSQRLHEWYPTLSPA